MRTLLAFAAFTLAAPAIAQEADEPATPTSVVAAASAEEWLAIAPEDLLVMELAPDAAGNPRRVVIQLMPREFSWPWVANIRWLAREHWWDGTSVNRVQDNYVTQWGDVTEARRTPVDSPDAPYWSLTGHLTGPHSATLIERVLDLQLETDTYAAAAGFWSGWPIAGDNRGKQWPIHCYGYVGVGRGYAPDTGTGADLYTIIGQPQRHMDRNLAVVGRIIEGMEHMSSLPRGSGDLGFYTDEEAHLRTEIVSVRLASEVENAPRFEYLDTRSATFTRYVAVRANRNDDFYTMPAGGVDVCSVQVPVRRVGE